STMPRFPDYSMHPTIGDAQLNLSRHETAHWWLSDLVGFAPGDIVLGTDHGSCAIAYPMEPESFAAHYERSPLQAAAWLTRIVAIIRVGCYAELCGGQYGGDLRGQDLADTQAWHSAV